MDRGIVTQPKLITDTIETWVSEMTAGLLTAAHKPDGAYSAMYRLTLTDGSRIVNVHFRDYDPSPAMLMEFYPYSYESLDRRHRVVMGELARKVLDGYRNYETEGGVDLHDKFIGTIYTWVLRNRCERSFQR